MKRLTNLDLNFMDPSPNKNANNGTSDTPNTTFKQWLPIVIFLMLLPTLMGLLRWIGFQIRGEKYDSMSEFVDLLGVQLSIITVLSIVFASIGFLKLRDWLIQNRQNVG